MKEAWPRKSTVVPASALPPASSPLVSATGSSRVATVVNRLLVQLLGMRGTRSRYTIAKFERFATYSRTTTSRRHTAVILLAPLPSFITSLVPTLIPLQDPALGVFENTGYMAHFMLTLALVMFGSVYQVSAPNGISQDVIPHTSAVLIAVVGTGLLLGVVTLIGWAWRFPVPFVWVVALAPYAALLVLGHVVVLRRKLWGDRNVWYPLLLFLPTYVVQASQVVVYPVFSAIFEIADTRGQIALTLAFPLVKLFYRSITRKLLGHLKDDANEVAVSGIEICAVMYQSMIMQTVPSAAATVIIMGLDAIQNVVHIQVLMRQLSSIRENEIVQTAQRVLFDGDSTTKAAWTEQELKSFASFLQPHPRRVSSVRPVSGTFDGLGDGKRIDSTPKRANVRSSALSKRLPVTRTVVQALEILQAAESVLLIEYFEVAVPITNALYLLWASQFDSGVYNPKIRPFVYDKRRLIPTVGSLAMYTVLQGFSLVVVYMMLHRRFGICGRSMLAFVLERHAWSVQGKLITWLALLFQFPVAHYGVDFTFKFDFARAHMGPPTP